MTIEPPSGTTYTQAAVSYILDAATGSIDASFGNGDTYSREVRVFAGKVSQVALQQPSGGD